MQIKLENVRLAFPELFVPSAFQGQGDKKYKATFLLPKKHPQIKEIESVIQEVAKAKWGEKAATVLASIQGNANKFCYKDGSTKPDYDGFEGHMFISASNKVRPTVVDRDRSPLSQEDGRPYAGCYVNAVVDIWAQDNQFGKGVNATLSAVQFFKDGDAFSGAAPVDPDAFDDLSAGTDGE